MGFKDSMKLAQETIKHPVHAATTAYKKDAVMNQLNHEQNKTGNILVDAAHRVTEIPGNVLNHVTNGRWYDNVDLTAADKLALMDQSKKEMKVTLGKLAVEKAKSDAEAAQAYANKHDPAVKTKGKKSTKKSDKSDKKADRTVEAPEAAAEEEADVTDTL